jgi:hypothetical protein
MISAILNSVLFALKLIAFATILCLFAYILLLLTFLVISSQKTKQSDSTPKLILTLPQQKKRRHNTTKVIHNDVLTTPTNKRLKEASQKPLTSMTSKELLAYAKQEKIKGYSSVYKTQKKLGLIKLIEQQPEFSELIEQQPEFSE